MNPRLRSGLLVASLVALFAGACSVGSEEEDGVEAAAALVSSDGAVSATISFNDWGSGYTGNVTVTNNGNTPTTSWTVVVDPHGSVVSQTWNATSTASGSQVTFKPLSWNAAIPAHQSVSFGFNAAPGGPSNLASSSSSPRRDRAEAALRPAAPRAARARAGAAERRAVVVAAAAGAGPAAPTGEAARPRPTRPKR